MEKEGTGRRRIVTKRQERELRRVRMESLPDSRTHDTAVTVPDAA
jgi:hypothetical protein